MKHSRCLKRANRVCDETHYFKKGDPLPFWAQGKGVKRFIDAGYFVRIRILSVGGEPYCFGIGIRFLEDKYTFLSGEDRYLGRLCRRLWKKLIEGDFDISIAILWLTGSRNGI